MGILITALISAEAKLSAPTWTEPVHITDKIESRHIKKNHYFFNAGPLRSDGTKHRAMLQNIIPIGALQ